MARSNDRVVVLRLAGVLDVGSAPRLRHAIAQRPADAALVIDLRELEFLDTTGVQILLQAHRAAHGPDPWPFALIPGDSTRRMFEITGMDNVLRWVDDPDDVL